MFENFCMRPYVQRLGAIVVLIPVEPFYISVQLELILNDDEFVPSRVIVNGSRSG